MREHDEASGDALNIDAAVVADQYLREAVDVFVEGFGQWGERQVFQSSALPTWVKHEIRKVADLVEAWSNEGGIPTCAFQGALIARGFLVPLDGLENSPSAYKSILTWRNAIRAGWQDVIPSQEESAVIEALKERRIPKVHSQYPARLPAALALSLRDSVGRLTPSHRVALAFYLYDLRIALERP